MKITKMENQPVTNDIKPIFIGYKSGGKKNDYLITLNIEPNDASLKRKSVVNKDTAKYRCRKAFVVEIQHKETGELVDMIQSNFNPRFIYKKGFFSEELRYDENIDSVCSQGIHFFITKEPAFFYNNYVPTNYDGVYKSWYENGELYEECNYKNGGREGPYNSFYENGQLFIKCEYKYGFMEGPYKSWFDNGQLLVEYLCKNGKKSNGPYKSWYESGQIAEEFEYKNGEITSLHLKLIKTI